MPKPLHFKILREKSVIELITSKNLLNPEPLICFMINEVIQSTINLLIGSVSYTSTLSIYLFIQDISKCMHEIHRHLFSIIQGSSPFVFFYQITFKLETYILV